MTGLNPRNWAAAVVLAAGFATHASGQAGSQRLIVVSLEDRKLALVEDGQVRKIYKVAVGKPSTPSPTGTYTIERRVANPVYQHDRKTVQPGPGNPVGTRWIGLNIRGYGIHGTNAPKSIGKAASHGCIRMSKADLEELYDLVAVGDTVELVGNRNEETAQLFDGVEAPAATSAMIAQSTALTQQPAAATDSNPLPAAASVETAKIVAASSR